MNQLLQGAIEAAVGHPITQSQRLSGGDINDAFAVTTGPGKQFFVKSNPRCPPMMFATEAAGLKWLADSQTLRIPEVIAYHDGNAHEPSYLILELLEPGHRVSNFDELLGRGLAELHRCGAPGFGLDHSNFIGSLPQRNDVESTWVDFYREQRLLPQLEMAEDKGRADSSLRRHFEQLFTQLPRLVGPPEPPARLHGDLWSGNLHVDSSGQPCLIDPAVYGGHREMDLAMMQLFGGFSQRTFAAYAEAYPLAPDYQERVQLYQLYPLMVHVNLFGGSYGNSVRSILRSYV